MNRSEFWTAAFAAVRTHYSHSPEYCAEFADAAVAQFDQRFRGGGSTDQDSTASAVSAGPPIEQHLTQALDQYIRCPAASTWEKAYLCALLDLGLELGLPRHPHHDELRAQHAPNNPNPHYTVDGYEADDPESMLAGDGQFAPFRIFDTEAQDYLPGVYFTRVAAEQVAARLNG